MCNITLWALKVKWVDQKIVQERVKIKSSRAVTPPKILRAEWNSNLMCEYSYQKPKTFSICSSITKKSQENHQNSKFKGSNSIKNIRVEQNSNVISKYSWQSYKPKMFSICPSITKKSPENSQNSKFKGNNSIQNHLSGTKFEVDL